MIDLLIQCKRVEPSICVAIIAVMFMAASAGGGTIRLRSEARVQGDEIRLSDIAQLQGDQVAAMHDVVIARFSQVGDQMTISLDGLRETLEMHQVNWGKVNLKGHMNCTVIQEEETAPVMIVPRDDTGLVQPASRKPLVGANLEQKLSIQDAITLQEKTLQAVLDHVGGNPSELYVQFSKRDQKSMQSIDTDDFVFEPVSASKALGRVSFRIHHLVDGQYQPLFTVSPIVTRRTRAAVAARKISRGQTITPNDLHFQEVEITHSAQKPIANVELVLGQVAGTTWRAGEMLSLQGLQAPQLVKRGDLITVHCVIGGILIKTTARASDAGGKNDVITARNIGSRENYTVKITGPKQAVAIGINHKQLSRSDF